MKEPEQTPQDEPCAYCRQEPQINGDMCQDCSDDYDDLMREQEEVYRAITI